jgi:hypothetical protein
MQHSRRTCVSLASGLGFALLVAACSGASTPSIESQCGKADAPCGSDDASVDAETRGLSDATLDARETDASSDARPTADAQLSDASEAGVTDAPVDAEPPSDPCPNPSTTKVLYDCDTKCFPGANCSLATCGPTVTVNLLPFSVPYIVRTPEAPGVDPHCATQCPGSGYVYGLGFNVDGTNPNSLIVRVGEPWEIIEYSRTPFCNDSHGYVKTGCAILPDPIGMIFIMTKDPNAPARDISFDLAGTQTCP